MARWLRAQVTIKVLRRDAWLLTCRLPLTS
jgi:hypothetical protein